MNITRHNYEEYLIDYLEGSLDQAAQKELQAFFKVNPDIEAEVNLLAQDMPVLLPDTTIVYDHKESLKKAEGGGKIVYWSLNNPRFYALSIAAALLLFSFGWWVMQYNAAMVNPAAQQQPAIAHQTNPANTITTADNQQPDSPTPTTQPQSTAINSNTTMAQTQASANTTAQKYKTATATQKTAVAAPTNPLHYASATKTITTNPAALNPANTVQTAASNLLQTANLNTAYSAPQPLAAITSVAVAQAAPLTILPPQTIYYPAITNNNNNQQVALKNKIVREVGKQVIARNNRNNTATDQQNQTGNLVAKVADALLPEAIAAANPKLTDPDITFSVAVSPGTHRFIRDFLNK